MRMSEKEYKEFRNRLTGRNPIQYGHDGLKKENKFHAVSSVHNGIRFDSKAERIFYEETWKMDPTVTHIDCHVKITLPGGIRYELDFIVWRGKVPEAVEVKGKETTDFRRMRKLFDAFHPLSPMKVIRKLRKRQGWEIL